MLAHLAVNTDLTREDDVLKTKQTNTAIFRFIVGFTKNFPRAQLVLQPHLENFFALSEAKFKDKSIPLLAAEIIENITNPS